jgi:hypothetical protein
MQSHVIHRLWETTQLQPALHGATSESQIVVSASSNELPPALQCPLALPGQALDKKIPERFEASPEYNDAHEVRSEPFVTPAVGPTLPVGPVRNERDELPPPIGARPRLRFNEV